MIFTPYLAKNMDGGFINESVKHIFQVNWLPLKKSIGVNKRENPISGSKQTGQKNTLLMETRVCL